MRSGLPTLPRNLQSCPEQEGPGPGSRAPRQGDPPLRTQPRGWFPDWENHTGPAQSLNSQGALEGSPAHQCGEERRSEVGAERRARAGGVLQEREGHFALSRGLRLSMSERRRWPHSHPCRGEASRGVLSPEPPFPSGKCSPPSWGSGPSGTVGERLSEESRPPCGRVLGCPFSHLPPLQAL